MDDDLEPRKALERPIWDPVAALFDAIQHNNVSLVQKILDEDKPDVRQPSTWHLTSCYLGVAIDSGNAEIVRMLIAAGAAIDMPRRCHHDRDKWTPIQLAASMGRRDIVKMLWDAGTSPVPGPHESILELAAEFGQKDVFEDVLTRWKDCSRDIKKFALYIAANRREPHMVRRLHKDTTHSSYELGLALLAASGERIPNDEWECRPTTPEDMALHKDTIEALLDAGANPNFHLDSDPGILDVFPGEPAVYLAATQLFAIEGLKLLLARGADPNARVWFVSSPLHAATERVEGPGHPYVVHEEGIKALLAHGALPTGIKDHKGEYPIHNLARQGNLDMLQLCLAADTDPDVLNKHRDSLLKANKDGKRPDKT